MKKTATLIKQYNSPRLRIQWVDYAKGIGIFLMVFGHALRGLVSSSVIDDSSLTQFIDAWIYAFHIPLFFFLSGLFVTSSKLKKPATWLAKKLKTMVYPYFLWSIIQILLKTGFSSEVNQPVSSSLLGEILYDPTDQFWFIYALFLVSLFFYVGYKIGMTSKQLLVVAIALCIAHPLKINFGSWGMIYLFRRHAIYFALGAIIGSQKITLILSRIKSIWLIFLGSSLLLLVGGLCWIKVDLNLWAVPLIALVGIAAIVMLSFVLDRLKLGLWLRDWGHVTLQIYLAHTIASAVFRTILQKMGIDDPITHLVLGTAVGIYIPIWLHRSCQKINFKYMFVWA